jgi:hypothetical protein
MIGAARTRERKAGESGRRAKMMYIVSAETTATSVFSLRTDNRSG